MAPVVPGIRLPAPVVRAAGKPPNIVFVLTDDQGYGDLACLGNPIVQTPNLDRLHGELMAAPCVRTALVDRAQIDQSYPRQGRW